MKKHLLTLLMAFLAQSALADVSLHTFGFMAANPCTNLSGVWVGSGIVKYGLVTCHYSGKGTIPAFKGSAFNMEVNLKKDSGWGCPAEEREFLPGTCRNGTINFQSNKANMTGSIGADGTTAELHGTVEVDTPMGVSTAEVTELHLHKQS